MKKIAIVSSICIFICSCIYFIISLILVSTLEKKTAQISFGQNDFVTFNDKYQGQKKIIKIDNKDFIYHYFERKSSKTIILTHGITVNKNYVTPIAKKLFDSGYNVILYDLRTNGENSNIGTIPSFSKFESDDLLKIISNEKRIHAQNKIGLYGVSMGGATTIKYAQKFDYLNLVDAYIAESCFASMYEQLNKESKQIIPTGITPFAWGIDILLKLKHNYNFNDASLEKNMPNIKHKMLLISPNKDPRIDFKNSIHLAKLANKKFVNYKIFSGHEHANSFNSSNKIEFYNILLNFYKKSF